MRLKRIGRLAAVATMVGCAGEAGTPAEPELLSVPAFAQAPDGGPRNFNTHATGSEEVPANTSKAQGQANFQLSADGTELRYRLLVANIHNVTQAHIHIRPAGANGPVVVWLYPSSPPQQLIPGRTQGVLGEGVITDANVVGILAGTGVAGLLEQIRAGNAYVNVHTLQYPPGEIRGQLD